MRETARQFLRRMLYNLIAVERKLLNGIRQNKDGVLAKMSVAGIFSLERDCVCRGLAVGFFWAFIPMPLQMFPAALFCWLCRGNLPLAIVSVWISNPFTYLPIFYAEYKMGVWFFDAATLDAGMHNFSDLAALFSASREVLEPLFKGALLLSTLMMCAGYGLGYPLHKFLAKRKRRKNAPHAR